MTKKELYQLNILLVKFMSEMSDDALNISANQIIEAVSEELDNREENK